MSPMLLAAFSVKTMVVAPGEITQLTCPRPVAPWRSHPDPVTTVMSFGDALPPEICTVARWSCPPPGGEGDDDGGVEFRLTVMFADWPGPSVTDPGLTDGCPGAAAAGCGATATLTMLAAVAKATNSPAYA